MLPPLEATHSSLQGFQRRAGGLMLLFLAASGAALGIVGVGQWLGWIPGGLSHTPRDSLRMAVSGLVVCPVTLLLHWIHEHHRSEWPLRSLGLFLVAAIVPAIPASSFQRGVPQAIWVPVLIAFALTSLRWSLFTTALAIGTTVILHRHHGAFMTPASVFVTAVMVVAIVTPRLVYDRTFRAERAMAADAQRLAFHDALTGLPNRRLLSDRLAEALKKARREPSPLAVICVDIDQFSQINATGGHQLGDRIITEVAAALRASVRESDTVARIGGDEFVVVLGPLTDPTGVERVLTTIRTSVQRDVKLADRTISLTTSLGVALFPNDGATAEELMRRADQALSQAKSDGRDRACYFNAAQQAEAARRISLGQDLRGALDRGEFHVVYQPIVNLKTGRIYKAEALLRWTHPSEGPISPATFIPIAEKNGVISEIGDWVFRTSARQVKSWRTTHDPAFQVSVNRSPVQFRDELGARTSCLDELDRLGLPGDSIALELTEGVLLESNPSTSAQLSELRTAGVHLSLDDFGTGYSSLSYLHEYEMDFVKIDRSFVRGLAEGSKQRVLCQSIVAMAHALGLAVVAEGVETEAQRDLLAAMNCDYAQGYLLGRPMSVDDLDALVRRAAAAAVHG